MKTLNYIGIMAVAVGMLTTATSCKDDWSVVDGPSTTQMSAGNTLWENIQLDPNLTQFAALVKKAGYDTEFSSSRYYTVWAPKDGTYNYEELLNEDSATLRNNFIENLVAEYAHNLSGNVNEKVQMLNDKSYLFSSLTSSIDDVKISKADIASSNGIMHEMDGNVQFRYNLYEYLDGHMPNATQFAQYFKQYETKTLNTKKSTIGPVVDGIQTYLDSVMDVDNRYLFRVCNAKLDREDSTYTMIVPTDKAWTGTYNAAMAINKTHTVVGKTSYYITYQVYENSKLNDAKVSTTVNYEYTADSLAKQDMAAGMFFNNNNKYNEFLLDESKENLYSTDTLYSTLGNKFYDAQDILSFQTGDKVQASNGWIRYVDSVNVHPWQTYDPSFSYYPSGKALMRNLVSNPSQHTVYREDLEADPILSEAYQFEKPETEYFRYVNFEKTSDNVAPEVDVYLSNVRARKYHFYAVIIPAIFDDTLQYNHPEKRKPNSLKFAVTYTSDKNKLVKDQVLLKQGTTAETMCDPNKVDTVDLGYFEFPISYYGTDAMPNLKISQTQSFTFNKANREKYEQSIRLAAVILKTPEYEAYEEQRKQKK